MKLGDVITKLRLIESAEVLQVEWESSQQSMPEEPHFLAPEFIVDACQAVSLPEEVRQATIAISQRIASNAALQALAWHFHHCLFRCASYLQSDIARWPSLNGGLQHNEGMFYTLVLLSGLPGMRAIYHTHRVPIEIARDTLSQVRFGICDPTAYRKEHGQLGLTPYALQWFRNHLCGELYRLGRLQFKFGSSSYKIRAFQHRTAGTVVVLSEAGVRYLMDGQVASEGRVHDDPCKWTSQLIFTDNEIIGHPILPTGCALQRKVCLPKAEWRQVLASGDPILEIHIPGGSPMTYDLCAKSFRDALKFFPEHFPERPFVAFCCSSWLLDGQLKELLPPTSNIVRFQREVYLFPTLSDDLYLVKTVFGDMPEDLTKVPRDTTLRRALLDRLLAGGHLHARAGSCFLLPDDVARWGSQVYRRQTFPW